MMVSANRTEACNDGMQYFFVLFYLLFLTINVWLMDYDLACVTACKMFLSHQILSGTKDWGINCRVFL